MIDDDDRMIGGDSVMTSDYFLVDLERATSM
jgi:hypothetical protein